MPGPKCVVDFCKNGNYKTKSHDKNLAFHRFPRDPELKQAWVDKCGKEQEFRADFAFVCSLHFHPDDYKRDMQAELLGYRGRRKLHPNAIPSQNLPYEEPFQERLSPEEKERLERERHNKIIEDCLKEPNNYTGVVSFEVFKKQKYKTVKVGRSRKKNTMPATEEVSLKESSDENSQNYFLNNGVESVLLDIDDPKDGCSIENKNNELSYYLNEDSEGAPQYNPDVTLENSQSEDMPYGSSSYLKKRVSQLEEQVEYQRKLICKLKRGILREKKMMEKVFLATKSGDEIPSLKKRKYDDKAKNALLEIYSLHPDGYSTYAKALNLPPKSVLTSWNPEICPPPSHVPFFANILPSEQMDLGEVMQREEYIIDRLDY